VEGNATVNKIVAVAAFVGTVLAIAGVAVVNRLTTRSV